LPKRQGIFDIRGISMRKKAELMDKSAMERALRRISHEIIEKNKGVKDVKIIGIQRRGVPLSQEIAEHIQQVEGERPETGILDITFYRDDLSLMDAHPIVKGTDIPFNITDKKVIIVDDVLYTGRTARAAIDALMDLGRPQSIQLAVLIDRGHRELPIRADYIGKNVPTSNDEVIKVHVPGFDDKENVELYDIDKD
jgi:pyrimidine operon attenuation protein/uracil phosphoribosyltransferase